MIPEFVGRLPVARRAIDPLTEDELMLVLTDPKNAMIKQYSKLFAMEGVNLTVTRDALRALAAQGGQEGHRRTGAAEPVGAIDARRDVRSAQAARISRT